MAKPKRRFRFTLRAMLVVMLLLSVTLGWFAMEMRCAQQERVVVDTIKEKKGNASIDHDWMGRVIAVHTLSHGGVSRLADRDLVHVSRLKRLEWLSLCGDLGVTDAGLGYLQGLRNLQVVDLRGTKVSERGARRFQNSHPSCRILHETIEDSP